LFPAAADCFAVWIKFWRDQSYKIDPVHGVKQRSKSDRRSKRQKKRKRASTSTWLGILFMDSSSKKQRATSNHVFREKLCLTRSPNSKEARLQHCIRNSSWEKRYQIGSTSMRKRKKNQLPNSTTGKVTTQRLKIRGKKIQLVPTYVPTYKDYSRLANYPCVATD
jgi:hypothetical protein